jgi:hypothetical protein
LLKNDTTLSCQHPSTVPELRLSQKFIDLSLRRSPSDRDNTFYGKAAITGGQALLYGPRHHGEPPWLAVAGGVTRRAIGVTPHVTQNQAVNTTGKNRNSAVEVWVR